MTLLLLLACDRTPEQTVDACNDYCDTVTSCAEDAPGTRWDGCVGWCQSTYASADFVACMDEVYPGADPLTGEDCNAIYDACLSSGALPPDME